MPEPHLGTELDQARLNPRGRRFGTDAEPPGGLPYQQRITGRLRRRHQQQPPGLFGQRLDPLPETVLDPPRQRHRAGQPEPAR